MIWKEFFMNNERTELGNKNPRFIIKKGKNPVDAII